MAPADQGGLFLSEDDEEPQTWVKEDPWDSVSYFFEHQDEVFTEVYAYNDGGRQKWLVLIPGKDSQICSKYDNRRIPMYDIVFLEMGLRLPFLDFQVAIFQHL